MATDRKSRLQEFVDWAAAHITGDEKGEAQIFLDRLLQAFSQKGLLEVGGKPEFRIRRSKEAGGGTAQNRRGLSQFFRVCEEKWDCPAQ